MHRFPFRVLFRFRGASECHGHAFRLFTGDTWGADRCGDGFHDRVLYRQCSQPRGVWNNIIPDYEHTPDKQGIHRDEQDFPYSAEVRYT